MKEYSVEAVPQELRLQYACPTGSSSILRPGGRDGDRALSTG